tara:strand:+ start:10 stop:255 length:246 start_codon:yes stop_codon:yes gene_type:complete
MTDIKNADTPANPTHYSNFTNTHGGIDEFYSDNEGLTKREHFAGLIIPSVTTKFAMITGQSDEIAELSVKLADALLKELAK